MDKFLLAGKNDKDQSIFQNLFDPLPDICKDKEAWHWVTEWKAFIEPTGPNNEAEFANLLKAFFKHKTAKKVLGRSKRMYVISESLPVDTSFHESELDRGEDSEEGNDLH